MMASSIARLYGKHFSDARRERLFLASITFFATFCIVRIITRLIRDGEDLFHNISVGGIHIHHLVLGIIMLLIVGYLWLIQYGLSIDDQPRWRSRMTSMIFGIGTALTLDEFALWLNLEDVYWMKEGRESIDVVILFGALLLASLWGVPFLKELSRSLVERIVRFPLWFIPPQMILPMTHGRLKGKKLVARSINPSCWLGSYEYAKRILFEKTVIEGSIVFDVGTHVGFYTLLASVLVGPSGRVFAFEPLQNNLSYLKQHLQLNNIKNVTVIEAAVSNKSGMASFDEGTSSTRGHISSRGKLQVKTVTIDELVAAGEVPLPDYIKMDIEGAETIALAGARSTLEKSHATIFLATHGTEVQRECYCFLESLGYRIQPLGGENVECSHELFATYDPTMEIRQDEMSVS